MVLYMFTVTNRMDTSYGLKFGISGQKKNYSNIIFNKVNKSATNQDQRTAIVGCPLKQKVQLKAPRARRVLDKIGCTSRVGRQVPVQVGREGGRQVHTLPLSAGCGVMSVLLPHQKPTGEEGAFISSFLNNEEFIPTLRLGCL